MSVLGIVAEYDPFHNGHLHHLRSAVRTVSPSAVLVALSGPFKQRGEPSMLSPFTRAGCALSAGADAVFALPVCWTVRDAEHYALGAVSLLSSLGATHLAFGAETNDLSLLLRTADFLEDSSEPLRIALRSALSEGIGYPAALAKAVGTCIPEASSVLTHANNILSVCYLRAVRRLGLRLEPVLIPRSGDYHTEQADPSSPSATAVRGCLRRGAWSDASSCLPDFSYDAVRSSFLSGWIPSRERMDALLLEKIRSMRPSEASCLPDASEGLDSALLKAAARAGSGEELVGLLTTRRYSAARIQRLCAYALLGISKEHLENVPLPSSVLLLGIKKNPSLTGLWKNNPVHVLSAAEWKNSADPADLAAWQLWGLACGLPSAWPFSQKMITLR